MFFCLHHVCMLPRWLIINKPFWIKDWSYFCHFRKYGGKLKFSVLVFVLLRVYLIETIYKHIRKETFLALCFGDVKNHLWRFVFLKLSSTLFFIKYHFKILFLILIINIISKLMYMILSSRDESTSQE